jgi:hypothetical protein
MPSTRFQIGCAERRKTNGLRRAGQRHRLEHQWLAISGLWLLQSQFFTRRERPTVNRRANQRSPAGFFRPVYRPLLLSPAL